MFTRTLYGGRISISVGLLATVLAISLGVIVGALSGYFGGMTDGVLMRLTDAFLSLPSLFVLILVSTLAARHACSETAQQRLGGGDRHCRAGVDVASAAGAGASSSSSKRRSSCEAAICVGVGDARIITRHILPNSVSVIIVQGTLLIAYAIIIGSRG